MMRLQDGFDAYATAQVPAPGIWTSGANVSIGSAQGRAGTDNAAFFDTSLGSVLRRDLILLDQDGLLTATYGHAYRMVTLAGDVTLAALDTAISSFNLILSDQGSLRIQQITGGVDLGTILQTGNNTAPVVGGGCYVAFQIQFQLGTVAARLMVSDQFGAMNVVGQGPLFALSAGDGLPNISARLGGGVGDAPATWWVDDVYLTDGRRTATPQNYNGRVLYNDGFLGNVHVQAFYATADGANLTSSGNVPWTPEPSPPAYATINEHPPDEDETYLAADAALQMTTCQFLSATSALVFQQNCQARAPIYAIQWDGRLRNEGDPAAVLPIVRRVVTGTLAQDVVAQGQSIVVSDVAYRYYPQVLDRNIADENAPWNFDVFLGAGVGVPGTIEFGVMMGTT